MVTQPYIVEQVLLGVKTEASYGTQATLTAGTDFLYVENVDLKIDTKGVERNYKHNALNALADAPGSTIFNLSFEAEYQTSGSAGDVLAPYGALEAAAGLKASVSASNSVTYVMEHTASSGFPSPGSSATVQVYFRDKLFTLTGVYGNIEETHKADGIVKLKFTGQGLYQTESSATMPAATFKENYVRVASASMSTHGYDPEFTEFTINYGNDVKAIQYAGTANGYGKVMIVGRKPVVTFKTLMDSKAGHDFIGRRIDKSTGSISLQDGSGTGNKILYTMGTTQYREVDIAEDNGVFVYNVTANVIGNFTKKIF